MMAADVRDARGVTLRRGHPDFDDDSGDQHDQFDEMDAEDEIEVLGLDEEDVDELRQIAEEEEP